MITRRDASARRLSKGRALVLIATAFLLAACKTDLYSNLSEQEANQMVAVLLANGIAASKVNTGDSFSVQVEQSDMLSSISLLNERGFPKEARTSIGTVFQKSGIMSSPFEERVRYIYALGEEVAQTLSQIDGVVTARVHIVLPQEPELGQPVKPSSAAVFIKHQPGIDLDFFVPQIRRLVSSSIEGLDYAAVTVVLSEAAVIKNEAAPVVATTTAVLPGLSVPTAELQAFWNYVYGAIAIFVALIAALGGVLYIAFRKPDAKKALAGGKPADMMEPT